jgi:MFS family permease
MRRELGLLALCQGLFLTNNITFIAINGLVGYALAPVTWLATLPVMGYVVGSALSTKPVSMAQRHFGRKTSFLIGIGVAVAAALTCLLAAVIGNFWLLVAATMLAGFYQANAQLYRFAAAEIADPAHREKAVSWVLAGGLLGAVGGPNLASFTRDMLPVQFAGSYLALAFVGVAAAVVMSLIRFPERSDQSAAGNREGATPRTSIELLRQPVFLIATLSAALSYGVMNLLMAATPLAMKACSLPFSDAALVLEWHVIGMFAPGFFTGHLIRRFGPVPIMATGVALYLVCIAFALSGVELHHFLIALLLLGVGWNFLFTASTTLSLSSYTSAERDHAQGLMNFCTFLVMAVSSISAGALVTTQGWSWLNAGSLVPTLIIAAALGWFVRVQMLRRAS